MIITYDDPFNLKDPRAYRASMGFLMKEKDNAIIEQFKKLHYDWTYLPEVDALYG